MSSATRGGHGISVLGAPGGLTLTEPPVTPRCQGATSLQGGLHGRVRVRAYLYVVLKNVIGMPSEFPILLHVIKIQLPNVATVGIYTSFNEHGLAII